MSNNKRVSISLEAKYKILADSGNDVSKEEIMRKYGLKSLTNIHRIQEN
jgi:hypothetical protein